MMHAHLLYPDRDLDLKRALPPQAEALTQDLGLKILFSAMALRKDFLFEVCQKVVLASEEDPRVILYRQGILQDCLEHPAVIRKLFLLAEETLEMKRKTWFYVSIKYSSPSSLIYNSVGLLEVYMDSLRKLRAIADEHAGVFRSEGFQALFALLKRELDNSFFARVHDHLQELKFRNGVLFSAELGEGNAGTHYTLRKTHDEKFSWWRRIFTKKSSDLTLHIHPRDEGGHRALGELNNQGLNLAAGILAQSCDHIRNFFTVLRTELAFYIGCMNLHEQLTGKGRPLCFPQPQAGSDHHRSCAGLYDACLALLLDGRIVGNDIHANEKDLVVITGANQGGKSTLLRGIGVAQLMMQCGMFVAAESFRFSLCQGLFTHFRREEDATMKSGKLDEELGRMSVIVDELQPGSMVLFNESFAATNEREGSEIARQITRGLREKNIMVFFVTHLVDFARSFLAENAEKTLFLRAERRDDGTRTFKLIEGEPLATSFGKDVYDSVFGVTNGDSEDCHGQ